MTPYRDNAGQAVTNRDKEESARRDKTGHPPLGVSRSVTLRSCHGVATGSRQHQSDERDELTALASRVLRLCPSHRDPEAFWVEKSELAGELRRLARTMGAAR